MTTDDEGRHSVADIPQTITDPDEVRLLEVANGFRQFDLARRIIEDFVASELGRGRKFRLRPSMILQLHGEAVRGLTSYSAGQKLFDETDLSAVEHLIASHFSTQLLSVAKAAGITVDGA
jgi:hypothetical protein